MALLDTLKDAQDNKYISFWGLVSHIIIADEDRSNDTYASNETYFRIAEALLRLRIHEKIRYFIYNPDDFTFKQIDEPETDEAKLFLKMLLPKSGKKIAPTEVIKIQNLFKNYFWLKESIEQVLPNGIVNFTNPAFFGAGEHKLLNITPSSIDIETIIELKRLQDRIDELESEKSNGSFVMGTPTVAHGEPKTYEQLVEALTAANDKIKQHEEDINRLNDQLNKQADNPTDKHLYNWQAMNQYSYPPELHLAVLIWEKSYILNEIDNRHITDHSQRFNLIAKKIGLDKAIHGGALISRLSKITNPQINKQKGDLEKLRIIKDLNIKDLDNSNPQG